MKSIGAGGSRCSGNSRVGAVFRDQKGSGPRTAQGPADFLAAFKCFGLWKKCRKGASKLSIRQRREIDGTRAVVKPREPVVNALFEVHRRHEKGCVSDARS